MERLTGEYDVSGAVTLGLCLRACRLAWRVAPETTWIFGDIAEDEIGPPIAGAEARAKEAAVLIAKAGIVH